MTAGFTPVAIVRKDSSTGRVASGLRSARLIAPTEDIRRTTPKSNYAWSSMPEREDSVETITRLPKSRASIEYAPGPRKAYAEVATRAIPNCTALVPRRCVSSSSTDITANAQTTGVSRPRQSKHSKARKAKCFHPAGNAMPARAQAMQPRNTSRAAPGAPPGNIE